MSLIPTGGRLASRLSDPVGQRETQAASQHIRFKGHVRRRVQLVGDRAGEDLGPKTCGAALRKAVTRQEVELLNENLRRDVERLVSDRDRKIGEIRGDATP